MSSSALYTPGGGFVAADTHRGVLAYRYHMGGDVRVIEDGIERDHRDARPGVWLWLLVGFVVGLGSGVVFLSPTANPSPPTTTGPQQTAPPPPNRPADPVGISQVVAGFPDALVAIVETESRSLEYHLWPVEGGIVIRSLPAGITDNVSLDAFGTSLAVAAGIPGEEEALLSMGKSTGITPMAFGVRSFRWHDSSGGYLSYTGVEGGSWGLWTITALRVPELVASDSTVEPGILAAWGDWGWAVYHPETVSFDLLTESGELRTSVEGVPFDSHQSGWLLVLSDRVTLVSAGGGIRALTVPPDAAGAPSAGSISPDAAKVALLGSEGLVIAEVDGGAEPVRLEVEWRAADLAWSSDSRFVLIPGFRGVTVVDTETSSVQTVMRNEIVQGVGVIPLSP